MRDLTEMNKLEEYLKEKGIEYRRTDEDNTYPAEIVDDLKARLGDLYEPFDRHQICVGGNMVPGDCDWDVICHYGSYGSKEGLLEGMGSIFGTDVEGFLTADEVIERIEK